MGAKRAALEEAQRFAIYELTWLHEIIYVGFCRWPDKRLVEHRRSGCFQRGIQMEVVEWHDTKKDALKAEKRRIKEKMPRYNIKHRLREDEMRRMNADDDRRRMAKKEEKQFFDEMMRRYGRNS